MSPEANLAMVDAAQLGRQIRLARLAGGLTQADVMGRTGSTAYLSRIERGERRPSPEMLERIATALGTDVPSLLTDPAPTAPMDDIPEEVRLARRVARATRAWLRDPGNKAAYFRMLRAVTTWEAWQRPQH